MSRSSTAFPGTSRRSDALRNRERLLEVARELYAAHGTDVALRDIAERAGVGVGTVYRHFPTPEAMLEAVMSDRFEALRVGAAALADAHDPRAALLDWLRTLIADLAEYRGLPSSSLAAMNDESSQLYRSCHGMRDAAEVLLRRAQQAGGIRPELRVGVLLRLAHALAMAEENVELMLSMLVTGIGRS
ncbi:helix-turn-helix domain-containing protein [Dactylosporangium sp. NPDC051484]|uniref:TetR/AcrR family transcriptional regulator n=1 Tax=Dactylosporangium sp. NPDC051484 TaxID=3154942 RepID=UPI0034509F64